MAITKQSMDLAFEQVKDFFKNLLNPNMKIEDIADVVSSRLDPIIIANEKKGLHYSAGKFYVKAPDEKHFQLEFEMFFKDDDDKWHKFANASELRKIELLEDGAAKTIQRLKVIEFPINAPEIPQDIKQKTVEEKFDEMTGVKAENTDIAETEDNSVVTIDVKAEEIPNKKVEMDKSKLKPETQDV